MNTFDYATKRFVSKPSAVTAKVPSIPECESVTDPKRQLTASTGINLDARSTNLVKVVVQKQRQEKNERKNLQDELKVSTRWASNPC